MHTLLLCVLLASSLDAVQSADDVAEALKEIRVLLEQLVDTGLYHETCVDNSIYNDCEEVVEQKLCGDNIYGRYCCYTCTRAGLLPLRGPHLDNDATVPFVTNASGTVKTSLGSDVILSCNASGYPEPEIIWTRGRHIPIFNNSKYLIEEVKHIAPIVHTVYSTLKISNIEAADIGNFYCMAINTKEKIRKSVEIINNDALVMNLHSGSRYVSQGDRVQLSCSAVAKDPPRVQWLFKGSQDLPPIFKIQENKTENEGLTTVYSQLDISSINYDHRGKISCKAENSDYEEENDLEIHVVSPPSRENCYDENPALCYKGKGSCKYREWLRIFCCFTCLNHDSSIMSAPNRTPELYDNAISKLSMYENYKDYTNIYGNTVTLDCNGEGYPEPPQYSFLKDGIPLHPSNKYSFEVGYRNNFAYKSEVWVKLLVKNSNAQDMGNYTCLMTSGAATAADSITLSINSAGKFISTNVD